jgi:hypothetical protein
VDFAREEFRRNRDVRDLVCFVVFLSRVWVWREELGLGANIQDGRRRLGI